MALEFEKELGVCPKREWSVINIVLRAWEIPNNFVNFLNNNGGYAIVALLKHEHVNYKVYNPKSKWAYLNVFNSKRETDVNIKLKY
jgi:hypothetical protein